MRVTKADSSERLVTLEFGAPGQVASADAHEKLYVSVLKQLLGEGMRKLIREELAVALTVARPHPETEHPVAERGEAAETPGLSSIEEKTANVDIDWNMDKHDSFLEDGIKELAASADLTRTHRGRGKSSRWASLNPMIQRLDRCRLSFGTMTAPNEDAFLRRLCESRWFHAAVNLVVVLNCVVMAVSTDYQVRNADIVASTDNIFFWMDVALLAFYFIEFLLRLAVYRMFFFYDVNWMSNYLDSILLFTSIWSVSFTWLASSEQLHQNYTWLRLFRLLRLLRTLRVIRVASYFKTLRAILHSLLDSLWTLFWSIAMLSLTFFMFSLIFVSRVAGYIYSDRSGWEAGEYEALLTYFGSVSIATKTLIMASTGGADWGDVYDVLEATDPLDAALFLVFIFFIQIALLNIILGIFVEDAMKHMQPDTEQKAHELALEQVHMENELRKLCCKTDLNNSGQISTLEWEAALEDGKVHNLLDLLGFPRRHANKFFGMMARESESGERYVNIEEFVKGCIKLRGSASSFDMNAVLLEVKDMKDLVIQEVKILHSLIHPRHQR